MAETRTHYRLTPYDTWFFRESRPMNSLGGVELSSVFPPPTRTVLGALRTAIGDATGIAWKQFNAAHALTEWIGFGDDLGPLALERLWVCRDGNRLYPAPASLLCDAAKTTYTRLAVGNALDTHLGRVRLPCIPHDKPGLKPMQNAWLTQAGMQAMLASKVPDAGEVVRIDDLLKRESRLGIALDATHTVEAGALYQTQHLRLKPGVSLELALRHASGMPAPASLARLGGEGRLASIEPIPARPCALAVSNMPQAGNGLVLYLLSDADCQKHNGAPNGLPPDFEPRKAADGSVHWHGRINQVALTIECAVLGKSVREGGWDMARREPRAAHSLIPAGSCYYARVADDALSVADAIRNLHGRCMDDNKLGRGLLACGVWPATENLL